VSIYFDDFQKDVNAGLNRINSLLDLSVVADADQLATDNYRASTILAGPASINLAG